MIKDFASFHNHSHFSVMDGISLPEEMIKTAKAKGLKSIAITDHGHCHGHADFYLFGKKHGVRTVFGVEAYVIHDLQEWQELKDSAGFEDTQERDSNTAGDDEGKKLSKQLYRKGHLVLLACNREGLANLYQLTYKAHKDGFYAKPRMDKKMLAQHSKGVIATSACMGGVIANKCWDLKNGRGDFQDIVNEAKEFDEIFGRGRFFLELQFNEHDGQRFINELLVRVHKETGIPLTVTTDSHYTQPEEWKAQELLYMLRSNKTVTTRGDKWDFQVKQLYIKSPEEMWQTFEKFGGMLEPKIALEAFQNTMLIDSLVDDYEPDTHKRLPSLPYPDPFMEMMNRAVKGLKAHGLAQKDEYKARLLHEMKIIKEKGFANYFLITQQIIEEARKTMLVGEGRGSSAASLVCYCLGITDLDPIEHDLLFERFMDPSRTEEPDIDVDFEDVEATKDMLRRMFGEQNVACLSSYGTFQIKGLLKDVGRVYDLPVKVVNDANKKIEKELKVLYLNQDKSTLVIKLEDVQRVSQTFRDLVDKYPLAGEHLTKLYGRNRHCSRHAAGVIIGDNLPAETALWVQKDKDTGKQIVQASFTEGIVNKNVSAMGFTKFDILSIATLKVIHYALRLISDRTGQPLSELREMVRSKNMKLNDPKIMEHCFWNGNFAGIFQFTEKGIRRVAKNVHPDTFVDISAISSIYRPGPLAGGFDKLYARNKHHPEEVTYDHPLLESILKKTRGCIVFQEQLMQICNSLGKMSWKDVNAVRKVLLKKDKSKSEEFLKAENERLATLFFKGCAENNFTGAQELLDAIARGAPFPKAWIIERSNVAKGPQDCVLCSAGINEGDKISLVKQLDSWTHDSCARPKNTTLKLWTDLLAFGGYGFNKAHSDAYSVMTMQCAFLATYHAREFYAALLTKGQSGDLQQYVSDIQRTGIQILPVSINDSKGTHVIKDNTIRLALNSVPGVGQSAVDKIVVNQPYTSFPDFIRRSGVGKTATAPLILAGAFDCFYPNMKDLDINYTYYNEFPDYKRKTRAKNKPDAKCWDDWLEFFKEENRVEDYTLAKKVEFENELFDFSLRGSPFEILERQEKIGKFLEEKAGELTVIHYDLDYAKAIASDVEVICIPVTVRRIFEKPQRNSQMFSFLTFSTFDGMEFDAPCFSTIWKWVKPTTKKGNVYMAVFNRKIGKDREGAEDLVVGRPGFGHSGASSLKYMFDVDQITL